MITVACSIGLSRNERGSGRNRHSVCVPTTAHDAFMSMMRDHVGPELLRLGLKGSGRHFEQPSETDWFLVGFQGSKFNTKETAKYTINLTVVSRAAWKAARAGRPHLPVRPRANISYGPFGWNSRIGTLMPGGQDRWWTLTASGPTEVVGAEMLAALTDWGLPAARARLSR